MIQKLFTILTVSGILGFNSASATIMVTYQGSLSTSTGTLVGNGAYETGTSISWNVSYDESTEEWTYDYEFRGNRKAVSHVIVETCSTTVAIDLGISGTGVEEATVGTYGPGTHGNSNPGILGTMSGVKIDTFGDPVNFSWTIITAQAPAWGDFYAKSGKDKGKWTYVSNGGFVGVNPTDSVVDGSLQGHLLIPGCERGSLTTIPEPSSLFLLLSSLGFALRRKRD